MTVHTPTPQALAYRVPCGDCTDPDAVAAFNGVELARRAWQWCSSCRAPLCDPCVGAHECEPA